MDKDAAVESLLGRVHALVGDELEAAEAVFTEELIGSHPCVQDVLQHVTRFRGKRLRPMLLLLSGSATGSLTRDHVVLAAVVEMIHTATLVHDDVLDDAETRRHVATVNGRWNNETSVLFGDYLFTHAFHLAASLPSTAACRTIGRATNLVCEGELAQVHERGNVELDEDAYFDIIEGKTGELCAVSCRLGAATSNAPAEVLQALDRYGRCLGIAFQIADDLLDICGTEETTGKSLGTDFTKQKLTLPLIRLRDTADSFLAPHVRELLGRGDAEAWTALAGMLRESDAVDYARSRAFEFAARARSSLEVLPDSPARRTLFDMVDFAAHRSY